MSLNPTTLRSLAIRPRSLINRSLTTTRPRTLGPASISSNVKLHSKPYSTADHDTHSSDPQPNKSSDGTDQDKEHTEEGKEDNQDTDPQQKSHLPLDIPPLTDGLVEIPAKVLEGVIESLLPTSSSSSSSSATSPAPTTRTAELVAAASAAQRTLTPSAEYMLETLERKLREVGFARARVREGVERMMVLDKVMERGRGRGRWTEEERRGVMEGLKRWEGREEGGDCVRWPVWRGGAMYLNLKGVF